MLSQKSVERPYTVLVAVVLVTVLGIVAFGSISTDLLPTIELPYVVVMTVYPGASPEEVELAVTRPLEAALSTSRGLSNISSVSRENSSMIMLEFLQGTNMDSTMIEMANSLDMVTGQLHGEVGKPMLLRLNPDMMPIMVASVNKTDRDMTELSSFVVDTVIPAFERIEGVATVSAAGLLEREIRVELDRARIDELNDKVLAALAQTLAANRLQLTDAQADIATSLQTMEEEGGDRMGQLARASVELDSAIAHLQAILAQEVLLEAQMAALEQERETLIEWQPLQPALAGLFPDGVATLTPEMYAAVMAQAEEYLPREVRELSQSELAAIEERLEGAVGRIAALDTEQQHIQARLFVLEAMKPQLKTALTEAQAGYEQLEQAKMTVTMELSTAQLQLASGQRELASGLDEFDKAQEGAFKHADIANMINADMVANILRAQNFRMPAGYLREGREAHLVKVGDEFDSLESLAHTLLVSLDGIGDVRLADVAEVLVTDNTDETYARVDGQAGVVLTFQKESAASTAQVAGAIHTAISQLSRQHEGLQIQPLMDQGEYINLTISSVVRNLLWGSILAILVLMLFLKDIRPTLVIALSIPVSLLFAITLMYFSNVTINIISLSGLALGVGMLVDNSIVVVENIYRMRAEGMSIARAAVRGTRQVSSAIIASTLTTVCVFLPIVFTQGISRQLFTDMGLTIAYSLMASLLVALTVVPTLASAVLTAGTVRRQRWFESLQGTYEGVLRFALNRKGLVLTAVFLLLGLSIYGVSVMGTAFIPQMDSPQMTASLSLPEDSDEDIRAVADEVMARVGQIEAVRSVGAMSGAGMGGMMGMGSARGDQISLFILLEEDRTLTDRDVEELILAKTQDLEAKVRVSRSNMDMSVLGGTGISIAVMGHDLDVLNDAAAEIAARLEMIEGTAQVTFGSEFAGTETRITVDKDAAMRQGLTVAQVYQQLSQALASDRQVTRVRLDFEEYPVIVSASDQDLSRINLPDYTLTGRGPDGDERDVAVESIAHIGERESPVAIRRDGQSRYVNVTAGIADGHNIGLVSRAMERELLSYIPPAGVSVEVGGENVMIRNAVRDLVLMIVLAILFIYLIMVAQFQSLLSPFIILFTLPLAFTGGLLLLWITGLELSVIAMLGFLVLAGVVVNNGIVFVDYVNQLRLAGKDKRQALVETGRVRLRPILMTALTTILALSTMSLAVGQGAEMIQPMAVVAMGGLAYATVLTLLVVPLIYDIMHKRPMKRIDTGEERSVS